MIQDIAYASYLVESKAPDGAYFEVAITLTDIPATEPAHTLRIDVDRLVAAPQISRRITSQATSMTSRQGS